MRFLIWISVLFLCSCGGDSGDSGQVGGSPPGDTNSILCQVDIREGRPAGGYFVGVVAAGFADGYVEGYGEALITQFGHVRVHIQGLGEGLPDYQFVGVTDWTSVGLAGELRPEACGDSNCLTQGAHLTLTSLCQGTVTGYISWDNWGATPFDGPLEFSLQWPTTTYTLPATFGLVEGDYSEQLAVFGEPGDVVLNVDSEGAIFFQSPTTGCTGNGTLEPHPDGEYNAYDVQLGIANCQGDYAYLNREFAGLATRSIGDLDWGDWLVLWLATPEAAYGSATDPAFTMRGSRL